MSAPAEILQSHEINAFYAEHFPLLDAPPHLAQYIDGWKQRELALASNVDSRLAKDYFDSSTQNLAQAWDTIKHSNPNSPLYVKAQLAVVYNDHFGARIEGRMPIQRELQASHTQLVDAGNDIFEAINPRSMFQDEKISGVGLRAHVLGFTMLTRTLDPEYLPWPVSPREHADGGNAVGYFNNPEWKWDTALPVAFHHTKTGANGSYKNKTAHIVTDRLIRQVMHDTTGTALRNLPPPAEMYQLTLDALTAEQRGDINLEQRALVETASQRYMEKILQTFPNEPSYGQNEQTQQL